MNTNIPISVIVCAKNEAENLRSFIPSILDQNYPDFEIVIINDASSDDTEQVIEEFQKIDKRIKCVKVENNEAFWGNKKYALTLGIKKAKNTHLLFTDADCAPQSKNWISHMANGFQPGIQMVLGYGGYFQDTSSFLNKLIRYETLLTAIQYFSYAKLGSPYMGVGRNLAYTSRLFYEIRGFANHLHLRSGDDDLFVNEAGTSGNTTCVYDSEAITRSIPKKNFKEWYNQKRRHVSVAGHYQVKHKLLLSLFYIARICFWLFFMLMLILQIFPILVLSVLGLKLILEGIVYFKAAQKLKEEDLVWFFPIFDLFLISMQMAIFISNLSSKPKHWK
ncbi:glycosyltransferase [Gramella sp. AN32]|uniref:Glycosyltransferase n=1 Tax=Christiangramia antarctica TaxID=2058158 RepID=A0ABW5X7Q5_9FLAO